MNVFVIDPVSGARGGEALPAGDTARFVAEPVDAAGRPVPGVHITWTSDNATVATVDPMGLATARAPGTAQIVALAGRATGYLALTVTDTGLVRVDVTPTAPNIGVGGIVVLTATPRDGAGKALVRPVTWSVNDVTRLTLSSNSGAHITATGVAMASQVVVRATATNSAFGTVYVSVVAGASPVVSTVSPSPLRAGAAAVIVGANFDPSGALDTVRIDGAATPVTAASPTQLTVIVPAALACSLVRDAPVQVTVGSLTGSRLASIDPARQVTLPVGGSAFFDSAAATGGCLTLPVTPGAAYLVGVYTTVADTTENPTFRLSGSPPAAALHLAARSLFGRAITSPIANGVRPPVLRSEDVRRAEAHLRVLEMNRRIFLEQRSRRRAPGAKFRAGAAAQPAFDPHVGDLLTVNVPSIDLADYCSAGYSVQSRVVYVGPKAVVLEDRTNATAGKMDATLQGLGAEFDAVDYGVVTTNFGDPLAIDPLLGNKGKVLMLFSKRVNGLGGGKLLAFISGCDFFPLDNTGPYPNRVSNEAAMFYGIALTTLDSLAWWRGRMRGAAPHETKHIASYAARAGILAVGPGFEESWLEEGTAQISTEIYARAFTGQSWKGHGQWSTTVGCEPPANLCGGDYPSALQQNFRFLYNYLDSLPRESPVGTAWAGEYGGVWSLVRWTVDQYAVSEAQLLTDLVHANASGVENLVGRAGGIPFPQLYSRWVMASALPRYGVAPADPLLTLPSWDQAGIFSGLSAQRPSYPLAYPLVPPALTFGDIEVTGSIPGGGMVLLELSGAQTVAQPIALLAVNGAALRPDSPLRLAIVRVR